jgi:hypothetical protein
MSKAETAAILRQHFATWRRMQQEKSLTKRLGSHIWRMLGAAYSSLFHWRKPMANHPMQNAAMNAAQGMIGSSMGSGLLTQGNIVSTQQNAYNQAVMANAGSGIYRDKWSSPRVHIEVDLVTNGYVLAVGGERMIAKDLEELQQHFIAQVVSKLVLEEAK